MPPFKPLLASHIKDMSKLKFPVLASKKLDGVRGTIQSRVVLSRSLKPLPNKFLQEKFSGLLDGLDGEFIVGDPTAPDAYRKTVSIVMSDDKPIDGLRYWVFDVHGPEPFRARFDKAGIATRLLPRDHVVLVDHVLVEDAEQLLELEAAWLAEGNEGVMVRDPQGRYKEGRSSENEGILLKLKQFLDSEAEVLGSYEQMHNANDEFRNELGRTARSTAKAGLEHTNLLGGIDVRDLKTGVEFSIGTGFDLAQRTVYWTEQGTLPGRIAKYKYFPSGGKDKPRHPVFLGWRDKRDM